MNSEYILLIEDNEDDVKLTQMAFKENNIKNKLVIVYDGAEALDYIFCKGVFSDRDINDIPVLILLDIKLPKVDGIEVLRQIRANKKTKLIPVVFLTSSNEEKDINNGYAQGCNSYVCKPVNFNDFTAALKHLGLYWLVINENPPKITE